MKYLVTGGAGFIGSHITKALVKRGDSVIVIDNLITGKEDNLKTVKNEIEFFNEDILNFELLKKFVRILMVYFIKLHLHQYRIPIINLKNIIM